MRKNSSLFLDVYKRQRFFNIEGTEDMLIDTVGMSTLFLPDLQYHFHSMDPVSYTHLDVYKRQMINMVKILTGI